MSASAWNGEQLFSSASVEWATPQNLFDVLHGEFDFVLDAAAQESNTKCLDFISPSQDGLACEWVAMMGYAGAVWLNPPWGRAVGKWVAKAFEQSCKHRLPVVCLLPANTDTKWWHDYVMHATQVRFIKGRLKFVRDDGHTGPCPTGAAVVVFTPWGGPPAFLSMARP
mgnify:CR=1 FL=1